MKKIYGLISLSIMVVQFSCTKDEASSSSVSQEMSEVQMRPVVNGDSVLQAVASSKQASTSIAKSTTTWYGNETLVYTSLPQTLTSTSAKAFETTSLVTGLLTGKTYRIAIEFTGDNPALNSISDVPSATMFQSLTNLSGVTTDKIESSDGDLAIINNVRSLWLSYARLKSNFQKAYIMINKVGTANVQFVVKVYESNDTYVTQNWVSVKDYIHYNQTGYPTFTTAATGRLYNLDGYFNANPCATIPDYNQRNGNRGDLGYCVGGSELLSLTQDRTTMKNFMTNALTNGKYLVVPINAVDLITNTNPSRAMADISTYSGSGSYGHVIIVVGMDVTSDGLGSRVYYKDGLKENAETRMCDLSLFLNANFINGNTNGYKALSLKSCGCN
jgi:hypothetical protein